MPDVYVKAISEPRNIRRLSKQKEPHSQLARILHLASLLAELVGNSRLDILSDLLEACDQYCDIDRERLNQLVETIQPQVKQLADVLCLQLADDKNYQELLHEAHEQICSLSESIAVSQSRSQSEESAFGNVMSNVCELRSSMDAFLSRPVLKNETNTPATTSASSPEGLFIDKTEFKARLTISVGQSRSLRQPISLILIGITGESARERKYQNVINQVLNASCQQGTALDVIIEPMGICERVLILPNHDKQQAVRHAKHIVEQAETTLQRLESKGTGLRYQIGAGVASVTLPPKNFPPMDLLETAKRCLAAAHSGDSSTVKSLEIY